MSQSRVFTYENGLLLILGLAFGIAFFDRNAAGVLVPFIEKDLALSNTQVFALGSGLSLTWALGAYLIARWSDASGARKPFLIGFLLIFSVCSVLSGLAQSYDMLLLSRLLMGAVEGPFLPVCLAIMTLESSEHRRGINAGIMQNFFAALLGQSLAPIFLVPLAEHLGWRSAFYIAGIPGLVFAVVVALWVREPPKTLPAAQANPAAGGGGEHLGLIAMLRVRNIALCSAIAVFMVTWFVMGWNFYPKYFIDVRHVAPQTMGNLMFTLGIASMCAAFVAPALSDRIGRKPVMVAFCLLGVLTPLAVMYFQGSTTVLGTLMFLGWLGSGSFPLYMGVIPSETISRRYAATAMGLVVGIGEVIGGAGINWLAGRIADVWNPQTTLLMSVGCCLVSALLCLFLVETAPVKVGAAAAQGLRPAPGLQ
jgi:MFS family permease